MGGYKEYDGELANLPPEAYGNVFDVDGPFDPDDFWLESANREDQITAVSAWFLARYCDPAMETPYNGREGGYLFVNGGPYNPADVIPDRFAGIVGDDVMQTVIDELHSEMGDAWAPVNYYPDPDDYDERFDFDLESGEPLRRLNDRLREFQTVLTLQGDQTASVVVEKMVFSSGIGALEAFLWETAHYWIENDDQALRDIVTMLPAFQQQSIKLSSIFEEFEGLRNRVKGHLQNMVWHRFDQVAIVFGHGLGVSLPSLKIFEQPLLKRHDIVHRSGLNKDGSAISISQTEINELFVAIASFAAQIDASLSGRVATKLVVTKPGNRPF
jgi:hypothetical protein